MRTKTAVSDFTPQRLFLHRKGTLFNYSCSLYQSLHDYFNELLPMYNVVRSMSRAGTPTDNAAMEAINGWIKAELFMDFHVTGNASVEQEVDDYIVFFNEQRPAYSLSYLTPKQFREQFAPYHNC